MKTRSRFLFLLLPLAACAGLKPLPTPVDGAAQPAQITGNVAALWQHLEALPRAARSESSWRSLARVGAGDLRLRARNQKAATACGGPVPEGFTPLELPAPGPDRAPLVAYAKAPPVAGRPVIFVVHGLFDSKHITYARVLAAGLARAGYGVVVPDMRWHGCLLGDFLPGLGPAEGADLRAWAAALADRYPESPFGLVGVSLGGLDVIHALHGEEGAARFALGAVALSPAAALHRTVRHFDDHHYVFDRGAFVLIDGYFRKALAKRLAQLPGWPRELSFERLIDELARRSGEAGTPAEYLARRDPAHLARELARPLLVIASLRDGVVSQVGFAELQAAAAQNPNVHVIETNDGGHGGHLGLYPEWTAQVLVEFFRNSGETQVTVQ